MNNHLNHIKLKEIKLHIFTHVLSFILCPYCGNKQKKPIKTWKYGEAIDVSRFKCNCGKFFNFYKGIKSSWTIPMSHKE